MPKETKDLAKAGAAPAADLDAAYAASAPKTVGKPELVETLKALQADFTKRANKAADKAGVKIKIQVLITEE